MCSRMLQEWISQSVSNATAAGERESKAMHVPQPRKVLQEVLQQFLQEVHSRLQVLRLFALPVPSTNTDA